MSMSRRSAPAELATRTDLTPEATNAVTNALNPLLADAFALYLKTKNFHWHMSGPHFRDYHLLLDEQGDQIFAMTDVLAERLHFSNAWRDRLHGLAPPWAIDPPADMAAQRRALYRVGAERYRDIALLLAAEGAMSRDQLTALLALARDWKPPAFPLTGRDVTALGIPPGPGVGRLLRSAHEWWEAGDFTASRAACLLYLKTLAAADP